jgi:hypothetical protein
MNTGYQKYYIWSSVLFLIFFTIGLGLCAGFIPVPSPSLSETDVAEIYQKHTEMIRLGDAIAMAAAPLLMPMFAVITAQILRIKDVDPSLAYMHLGLALITVIEFFLPTLFWAAAAFRPDRDPSLTFLLNDVGWIIMVMPSTAAALQNFTIGIAILGDKSEKPLFPRWIAYFNFWSGILYIPAIATIFFKSGPFSWGGIIPFWLPLDVYGIWIAVMIFGLYGAINVQNLQSKSRAPLIAS